LLLVAAAACGAPPPSLVVVTLDTLRRDHVGAYAPGTTLTPALDALAARGLVFDAAYTTMPTTGPAHISLFTGLLPSEHGSRENGEPMHERHAGRELGELLRRRGYVTAAFVTSKLAARRATGLRGFELYEGVPGVLRPGADAVESALAWLRAEQRRPVFLWVHLYDSHAPYGSPDEKRRGYPLDPDLHGWVDPERFATPEARARMRARYADGVRAADAALGRLVDGLGSRFETPPYLFVVSDHGEALDEQLEARGYAYDHGEFLDPEAVALALVATGPGVAPGRPQAPVSIRDLYTTLLEAGGVRDPRAQAEGRRNLLGPQDPGRTILVERRRLGLGTPERVRAHALGAFDARGGLVLAEDGSVTLEIGAGAAERLATPARRHLASVVAGSAPEFDPETREALRSLGYAD
jgi:arylsulfatase A-like enzyme